MRFWLVGAVLFWLVGSVAVAEWFALAKLNARYEKLERDHLRLIKLHSGQK